MQFSSLDNIRVKFIVFNMVLHMILSDFQPVSASVCIFLLFLFFSTFPDIFCFIITRLFSSSPFFCVLHVSTFSVVQDSFAHAVSLPLRSSNCNCWLYPFFATLLAIQELPTRMQCTICKETQTLKKRMGL